MIPSIRESRRAMKRDDRFTDLLEAKMVELTSAFSEHFDPDIALGHITTAAVDLVDGIDYADVMLIEGGSYPLSRSHCPGSHRPGPRADAPTTRPVPGSRDLRLDRPGDRPPPRPTLAGLCRRRPRTTAFTAFCPSSSTRTAQALVQ